MTEGIDTSWPQTGISFKRVRAAGKRFVAISCGGASYLPLHNGSAYRAQIDAALKVFPDAIAHYWVVGKGSPTTEADFFLKHLHRFGKRHVYMLDNERLDSNATFWTDGQTHEFFARIHEKSGDDYARMWLYVGQYNYETHSFAETRALGVRIMIAGYSVNDGLRHSLPIKGVTVHQYSSVGHIAGYTVDLDHSDLSVSKLFPANAKKKAAPAAKPKPAVEPDGVSTITRQLHPEEEDMKKAARNVGSAKPQTIAPNSWTYLEIDGDPAKVSVAVGAQRSIHDLQLVITGLPAMTKGEARLVRAEYKDGKQTATEEFLPKDILSFGNTVSTQVRDEATLVGDEKHGTRARWQVRFPVEAVVTSWQDKIDFWTE